MFLSFLQQPLFFSLPPHAITSIILRNEEAHKPHPSSNPCCTCFLFASWNNPQRTTPIIPLKAQQSCSQSPLLITAHTNSSSFFKSSLNPYLYSHCNTQLGWQYQRKRYEEEKVLVQPWKMGGAQKLFEASEAFEFKSEFQGHSVFGSTCLDIYYCGSDNSQLQFGSFAALAAWIFPCFEGLFTVLPAYSPCFGALVGL